MSMLRLVGPRVLVRRLATSGTTRSGLVLPDSARELPQLGRVVAVGTHKIDRKTRERRPLDVRVGQLVMFPKYHDLYVELEGERLLELRHDEILAVVEE